MSTLNDNLIAYWRLDESSGNAIDYTGTYAGTNSNVTFGPGLINNCGTWNSTNSYITLSSLPFGASGTINVWYNTITNDGYFYDSTNGNRFLATSNGAGVLIYFNNADAFGGYVGGAIPTSGWHMFSVTWGGGSGQAYIDGVQIATANFTVTPTTPTTFYMGNRYSTASGFGGKMDEFGIWSRKLTADELLLLYNRGQGKSVPFFYKTYPFYNPS